MGKELKSTKRGIQGQALHMGVVHFITVIVPEI